MGLDFDSLKTVMISFTAIVGDERGNRAVSKALYQEHGIAWQLVEAMPKGKYGPGIDLILIGLFVEGEHKWFTMPKSVKLGSYSKKEKAIRFDVPIGPLELPQLEAEPPQRNLLFADIFSSLHAAVSKRAFAPEIQFDKTLFLNDLQQQIDSLNGR
jgi:hypothetical protein